MNEQEKLEIIKEMQEVAAQMRQDDIDENPDILSEMFDCDCCGKYKCLAGSIRYGDYRLCNDCVLLAEIGFKLGKFKNAEDLIRAMEDTRLEELCNFIKSEENRANN